MTWQHGLFGCFDNIGLCLIAYFVPCYQLGKNAEKVGDNCLLCGLSFLLPPANVVAQFIVRGKIREMKGIEGTVVEDLLIVFCCTCCALVQEAQELEEPSAAYVERS
ncbi:cell number regulator 10 [Aplysia californica]|uniref:Cell number regulator 10 n=1 Tax=Aplysia californica TaxID=6500 RepID=A0ABM1ABC0_APLCA|nr:cell number regulator 10 [Aplysia californica]